MCARRFLIAVFVLTLAVVAAAFAIFQWGGQVLVKSATPRGHFEAAAAGSGPDYAKLENWIARPGLENDPSQWLPEGAITEKATEPAAVFFIHPTTYLERDRWNAPLDHAESQDRAALFVRSQASAFNQVADIWAPKYRQAAYGAFLLNSADANQALDLAYGDVARAFDHFLGEIAPARPVILAAHSQGSLHLLRLLADHRDEIRGRLVAAYAPGWPIATGADVPALPFPDCRRMTDTACILSWLTFAEPANPRLLLSEWEKSPSFTGRSRRGKTTACVNPITGTDGGLADPGTNPGTLVPTADFRGASLQSPGVGAHCNRGLLMIDGVPPALGPYVLPGNNYHVYDYALFWGAVRRDAERRLAAWRR